MNPIELLNSSYTKNYTGPILIIDPSIVTENINRFKQAMHNVEINYAVKANPDKLVLRAVKRADQSFEVASAQEILFLKSIHTDFSHVLYSNSTRTDQGIDVAVTNGITTFVVDGRSAVDKLVQRLAGKITPCLYVRLIIPNGHSKFPLTGKFGIETDGAKQLIDYTKQIHNIDICGVSFHVGSQCLNPKSWKVGIEHALVMFDYMRQSQITPKLLNIGGGFPVEYTTPVCSIEEIGSVVNKTIEKVSPDIRIVAEPGRYLAGNAGHLLCQVIKRDVRKGKPWIYLDVGVFHGLAEGAVDGFEYKYITRHNDNNCVETAIVGPTCDSADIVTLSQMLPADVQEGDFVVVKNVGTYTTTYGTEFNGFPSPTVTRFTP